MRYRGGQKISRVNNSKSVALANINCSRMIPQLIARYSQANIFAAMRLRRWELPCCHLVRMACALICGKVDRMSGLVKTLGQIVFGGDISRLPVRGKD